MMYLLFIALSILNIPIGWLHINKVIAPQLLVSSSSPELGQGVLGEVYRGVEDIRTAYLDFVPRDEFSGEFSEPTGYVATDLFFLNNGNGRALQSILKQLPADVSTLPESRRLLFEQLFELDLQNGLIDDSEQWVQWKFKHVPTSLAEVLLNELLLRIQLIEGQLQKGGDGTEAAGESLLQQVVNLDRLVYGDTLKVNASSTLNAAWVLHEDDSTALVQSDGERHFVANRLGNHTLVLRSNSQEERYDFEVVPARISSDLSSSFATYFEGATSKIRVGPVVSKGRLQCSSDPSATFSNNTLQFTPNKSGWTRFKLFGANGVVVLNDSVYVQAKPMPKFKIKGLQTDGSLPYGQEELEIEAFSASVDGAYKIKGFQYQVLGNSPKSTTVEGAKLSLDGLEGSLWIHDIQAVSGSTIYKSDNSYIVTIEP